MSHSLADCFLSGPRSFAVRFVLLAACAMASTPLPLYAASGTWTSTATGLWSDTANWSGGTVADESGYSADFSTIDITSDVTIHLDSMRGIGNLLFGDIAASSAGGWVLDDNGNSGNALTLVGSTPTITVNELGPGKTATISVRLVGTKGLTKAGGGTLVLSRANFYSGWTSINVGTLVCGANDAIPDDVVMVNGGTLSMGSFSDSVGYVRVDGGGRITSSGSLTSTDGLCIGYNSGGTMEITSGGKLENAYACYVGHYDGSSGTATVDGTGSNWTNNDQLFVGYLGTGALNITAGGSVSNTIGYLGYQPGRTGTVTVDGTGSMWTNTADLNVGYCGSGTLKITGGGAVHCSGVGYIGASAGSSGTVTVDGTGSKWTSNAGSQLYVGYSGTGTLNITGGGMVGGDIPPLSSVGVVIGGSFASMGIVTVDGAGSKWTGISDLYVGYIGTGRLDITAGGSVSSGHGHVGYFSGSTATVTVDGAGSTWNNGHDLDVGDLGMGTVTQTGGTVSVAGTLSLGNNFRGNGTYNLEGGVLALSRLRKGGGTATFNFGGGTLWANAALSSAVPMTLTGTGGNANVYTAGYPVTLSGELSGPGGLNKLGTNTLTLAAANTYTGDTAISAGTLTLDTGGSLVLDVNNAESSIMTVAAGAELDLLGTVRLDVGDVTAFTRNWTLISNSGTTIYESSFALVTTDGALFTQVNDVWTYGSGLRQWTFTEATGVLSLTTVPEPSALALLAISAIGLMVCAWRRRQA
jgi:T5SS/PEP-CTERM-associated repeat protein/autotransporter-associated beta strand protein